MTGRRHLAAAALLAALAALPGADPAAAQYAPPVGPDPLSPPRSGGLAAVDDALARLSTHRRLLVIGAHPDDEDTAMLAWVAGQMGGEAAYLSLSRGEGGQNLIGEELGVGLGLLRTGELLAARGVDGARQFFTRAYDFGYTRSLEETLRRWPEEAMLEDAMRVVRRFRPQVIVSVFPGDGRAGHGQHQAAGRVAQRIFELADEPRSDPGRFPALDAEGWPPWRPRALYQAAWWRPEEATMAVAVGGLDPLSGRSTYQVAMASRSRHRSQDMGTIEPPGPRERPLTWVAGAGGVEAESPFAGIDTSLAAIAGGLPEGKLRGRVEEELATVEAAARSARVALGPASLAAAVEPLAAIVSRLAALEEDLAAAGGPPDETPGATTAAELVAEKRRIAEGALLAAASVVLDARADREAVPPGEPLEVTLEVWSAGGAEVGVEGASVAGFAAGDLAAAGRLAPGELAAWSAELPVPPGTPPTLPYFLRRPRRGDIYDWSAAPAAVRGEPLGPPPLAVRAALRVAGVRLVVEREVVHRSRDQAVGEIRRPVRVVPALEVTSSPALVIWPLGRRETAELDVAVRSWRTTPLEGRVDLADDARVAPGPVPGARWPHDLPDNPLTVPAQGTATTTLTLTAPPTLPPGRYPLTARVTLAGDRHSRAVPLVEYDHVRPIPRPAPAALTVSAFPLELPDVGPVGYVRGASDRVPELLARAGVPVELLDAGALTRGDFADFRAVVVGSRAYETEPALAAANPHLLEWVERGGLLLVQYQQYAFAEGAFAPWELAIDRPHDRITDEAAPVRLLAPAHPVLTRPNRLQAADWEGWVQERGLYFAATWGEELQPLLAMADPGGEEVEGALLVGRYGEGTYVYTGLAFFRQLPAGVPGAWRLFANLLALASPAGEREEGASP